MGSEEDIVHMCSVQSEAARPTQGRPDPVPPQEAPVTSLGSAETVAIWRNYKIFVDDPFPLKGEGVLLESYPHIAVVDLTLINSRRWRLQWCVLGAVRIIQQVLKSCRFVGAFMRCQRNLTRMKHESSMLAVSWLGHSLCLVSPARAES